MAYRKVQPTVFIQQGTEYNTCDGTTSLSALTTFDANNAADWTQIGGQGTITSSGQVSGIPANSSGVFQAVANNGGCTASDNIDV